MRYSDDFIAVIPKSESAKITFDNVKSTIKIAPRLELQPEKTQYFRFEYNQITNCGNEFDNFADCSNQFLNFLGFTFDGLKVRIRAKTTTLAVTKSLLAAGRLFGGLSVQPVTAVYSRRANYLLNR